jgi:hypothetical protein
MYSLLLLGLSAQNSAFVKLLPSMYPALPRTENPNASDAERIMSRLQHSLG